MFGQFPFANGYRQRLWAECVRWVRAYRDWVPAAERAAAREARALKLLREWLSPEQLMQYKATGYFDVIGRQSKKRYRIHRGTAMNVHEIDQAGNIRFGWCFVPDGPLAAGDVMLAQKIALETDEWGALAVAKKFTPRELRSNIG